VPQLLEIDELSRGDHWHLRPDDACHYMREHISRGGYDASATNQLISNLKKKMDRKGKPEWSYKTRAIQQAARELRAALDPSEWDGVVIVPMPPSKARVDPLYDDRMLQIARQAFAGTAASVRELIFQGESRAAFHETEERRDVAQLTQRFQVDESQCEPPPRGVIVLDDVLTTGAHFVAAKTVLQRRFGTGLVVIGIFIARRVFPAGVP
jgi:hypothetical protein